MQNYTFEKTESGYVYSNSNIELQLLVVGGKVFLKNLKNLQSGYSFTNDEAVLPIVYIPGFDYDSATVTFDLSADKSQLLITFKSELAQIFYTVSLCENLPIFNASVKLSGKFNSSIKVTKESVLDGVLDGKPVIMKEWVPENASIVGVGFNENHLNLTKVELFDATDNHNVVKKEQTFELFSPWARWYQGNIFIVDDFTKNQALMLVKESPSKIAQTGFSDFDFYFNKNKTVAITGVGLDFSKPFEIDSEVPLYSATVVVGDKNSVIKDYHRYYLKKIATSQLLPQITSNTWGDGNADSRINHDFILKELEVASFLGVDVVQLDDGWQKGHTAGSKVKKGGAQIGKGMYDQQQDFWEVRETFKNGLAPILEKANELGVEIGLWYSCDATKDYKYYQTDIKNVCELFSKHNVTTFKIDGVRIENKKCEKNVIKILETVTKSTQNKIKFNMDITAGKRFGYLYNIQYGNLFLENRYTKNRTYYPSRTLKNLWELSKYIPSIRFQIEVCNLKNNVEEYKNDLLSISNYSIDYAFAVSMMANPLIWMEMQNLSDDDKVKLSKIISVYKAHRESLSKCFIQPIGLTPSGVGFTGFKADDNEKGYLLLFKEQNSENSFEFNVQLKNKKLTTLYKSSSDIKVKKVGNKVVLKAKTPNSFIFIKYE